MVSIADATRAAFGLLQEGRPESSSVSSPGGRAIHLFRPLTDVAKKIHIFCTEGVNASNRHSVAALPARTPPVPQIWERRTVEHFLFVLEGKGMEGPGGVGSTDGTDGEEVRRLRC